MQNSLVDILPQRGTMVWLHDCQSAFYITGYIQRDNVVEIYSDDQWETAHRKHLKDTKTHYNSWHAIKDEQKVSHAVIINARGFYVNPWQMVQHQMFGWSALKHTRTKYASSFLNYRMVVISDPNQILSPADRKAVQYFKLEIAKAKLAGVDFQSIISK